MRRREFIKLLGGALAAWPVVARAQVPGKVPTIGFLGTPSASAWTSYTAAFVRGLRELGWIDGRTVTIEYRWAEGRGERFGEIAAEFVRLKVDVIVTSGAAVTAVKQATAAIPIVFAIGADPISSGYVASLARPGGNVTGLSLQASDVAGKRLELIHEAMPTLRRLAILANVGYPASVMEMAEIQTAARAFTYDVVRLEIQRTEDIEPAFASLRNDADALYVCGFDPLVVLNRDRINAFAQAARLPTISGEQLYVEAGGLMSYGPDMPDLFRRASQYVDKILRGAKPGDLPVEQPTKFDLVINLKTAKALGLALPPTLLTRADEVIE
jgi:putative tryptophan/tyrosine transport system substrate-binding protein